MGFLSTDVLITNCVQIGIRRSLGFWACGSDAAAQRTSAFARVAVGVALALENGVTAVGVGALAVGVATAGAAACFCCSAFSFSQASKPSFVLASTTMGMKPWSRPHSSAHWPRYS